MKLEKIQYMRTSSPFYNAVARASVGFTGNTKNSSIFTLQIYAKLMRVTPSARVINISIFDKYASTAMQDFELSGTALVELYSGDLRRMWVWCSIVCLPHSHFYVYLHKLKW